MNEELHQIELPEDVIGGVYADFVSVWHTDNTFTFDFAAMAAPPEIEHTEEGEPVTVLKSRVVARVRIPPEQVFEIMKALEQQLTAWEAEQAARRAQ
jgi:hypothetical protein